MNDPLGDMLTRIRNAQLRRRPKVTTPASNLRARVLDVLADEGYIRGYARIEHKGGKPEFEIQPYAAKFNEMARTRQAESTAGFRDQAAAEPGAVKSASGLVYKTMTAGTGASPKASDTVKVHYHGTMPDGRVFDSSVQRGEPVEFALNQVIPCWTEGVQKMKVGEKAKLVCPSSIAYGDQGRPPTIPGGATLVFEVELLEILKG